MQWVRCTLFLLGQIISILIWTPVSILAFPLPAVVRSRIISGWAYFILWWLRICCRIHHRIIGLENLPEGPAVILSKHQSAWETVAFQTLFPAQAWVLKRELLWIPIFGWGLAASRPIAIDRKAGVRALAQIVKQGLARLAEGRWVVIFPEGTRIAPGMRGRYNPGGAMLAVKAKVPVVPVAHNAGEHWSKRGFLKTPGIIEVRVGAAIDSNDLKPKQLNRKAEQWIEQAQAEISNQA